LLKSTTNALTNPAPLTEGRTPRAREQMRKCGQGKKPSVALIRETTAKSSLQASSAIPVTFYSNAWRSAGRKDE